MSTEVSSIHVELGADASGLERGLATAEAAIKKVRTNVASLAESTVGLKGRVNDFSNMLQGATPQNMRYAASFDKIQKEFEEGEISIGDARRAIESLRHEMGLTETKTVTLRQKLDGLDETFNDMKGGIMAASAAAAGFVAASYGVYKFAEAGAKLYATEERFDRLTNTIHTTSAALMGDLIPAVGSLMSKTAMMAAATEAISLGLVKTHDQAVRLVTVAAELGMDTNQMVLALTNQTTMRFDQLNMSVDGFDERLQTLKDSGMDVNDAFTEAFLQQAEKQIERVGSVADTTAGSFITLENNAKDLLATLQKLAALGVEPQVKGMTGLTSAAADGANNYLRLAEAVKSGKLTFAQATGVLMSHVFGTKRLWNELDLLEGVTSDNTQSMRDFYMAQAQVADSTKGLLPWQDALNQRLQDQAAASRNAAIDGRNLAAAYWDQWQATKLLADEQGPFMATQEQIAKRMGILAEEINKTDTAARNAAAAYGTMAQQLMGLDKAGEVALKIQLLNQMLEEGADPKWIEEQKKKILLAYGEVTEATLGMEDAILNSFERIHNKKLFDIDNMDFDLFYEAMERLTQDGEASFDDLKAAVEEAGGEVLQQALIINGIDLGEAIGQTSALAGMLGIIFDLPGHKDFTFDIDVKTKGPIWLLSNGYRVTETDDGGGGGTFVPKPKGKASGGPVIANEPYFVGEQGIEMFVPNTSGNIVPNNQLQGGQSNNNALDEIKAMFAQLPIVMVRAWLDAQLKAAA